jgi:hypothetical protein
MDWWAASDCPYQWIEQAVPTVVILLPLELVCDGNPEALLEPAADGHLIGRTPTGFAWRIALY